MERGAFNRWSELSGTGRFGYLWANEMNGDPDIEACPTPIRRIDWPAKTQSSREAGTVSQGEAE
jgi:hypothetical protein